MNVDTKNKSSINLDIDGYFRIGVEAEEELRGRYSDPRAVYAKLATHPDASVRELFELYYWQARSSLVLIDDQISSADDGMRIFKEWQQASLSQAIALTEYQLHHGSPPKPDWMEILKEEYFGHIEKEFPKANDIPLSVSMEPRFSARAMPDGSIKISSHIYGFLKALNISLMSTIDETLDEEGNFSKEKEPDIAQLGRFSIPHYIYLHDCIPVAVLPYRSVPSMDIYSEIVKLTHLQVNFIVAHEYAHFALGHIGSQAQTKIAREQQEEEADLFALKVCWSIVEGSDYYPEHLLWNAYRFLYQYQIISELISSYLRGKTVDIPSLSFEKRRGPILSEFIHKRGIENFGNMIELAGTFALLELKGRIYNAGKNGIRDISNILANAIQTKGVEPWWSQL